MTRGNEIKRNETNFDFKVQEARKHTGLEVNQDVVKKRLIS